MNDAPKGAPNLPPWTGAAIAVAVLAAAVVITVRYGLGAALIVLAGAALVLFIWLAFRAVQAVTEPDDASVLIGAAMTPAAARKTAAMRALKDLDNERSLGNLSDQDYRELEARYRDEAKQAMRAVDEERAMLRERAEALAAKAVSRALDVEEEPSREEEKDEGSTHACPACKTTNDADAAFCKRCGEKLGDA